MAAGEGGEPPAHGQLGRASEAGEPELDGAVDGSHEGGVAPAAVTEAEGPSCFGEVEVEARRAVLEARCEPAHEPNRRRAEDPQPVVLDVPRARVETELVEDLVRPGTDVEDFRGKAKLRVHVNLPSEPIGAGGGRGVPLTSVYFSSSQCTRAT